MELSKKYLIAVLISVAIGGARGYRAEKKYSQQREKLKDQTKKLVGEQQDLVEELKEKTEAIRNEARKVLEEYTESTENLNPLLANQATLPYVDIIQTFINSTTEPRQGLRKITEQSKIHKDRARRELEDTEQIFNKIKQIYNNKDDKQVVQEVESKVKRLAITRDVIKEIKTNFEKDYKKFQEHKEQVEFITKKMISYRYLIELVSQARNIVVSSKNTYLESFNTRDVVRNRDNKLESMVKKAKLLSGEAVKRGLYKTDISKIEKLVKQISQIKEKHSKLKRESITTWEKLKNIVKRQEEYENLIKKVAENNKRSPNTGYTKSKSYFEVIERLKKMTDKGEEKMKEEIAQTAEMLNSAEELLKEIDEIIKRKTIINKKVPSLITPERYDVDLGDSDDEGENDHDPEGQEIQVRSSPESLEGDGIRLEGYRERRGSGDDYQPDMSRRVMRTRADLDQRRTQASGEARPRSPSQGSAPPPPPPMPGNTSPSEPRRTPPPAPGFRPQAPAQGRPTIPPEIREPFQFRPIPRTEPGNTLAGDPGLSPPGEPGSRPQGPPNGPSQVKPPVPERTSSMPGQPPVPSARTVSQPSQTSQRQDSKDSDPDWEGLTGLVRNRSESRGKEGGDGFESGWDVSRGKNKGKGKSRKTKEDSESKKDSKDKPEGASEGVEKKKGFLSKAFGLAKKVALSPFNGERQPKEDTQLRSEPEEPFESARSHLGQSEPKQFAQSRGPQGSPNWGSGPSEYAQPGEHAQWGRGPESEDFEPEEEKVKLKRKIEGSGVPPSTQSDIVKLIDAAVELKKQFEKVTSNLKTSTRLNLTEIMRRILGQSLRLYLTGVCEAVLDLTREG